MAKRKSTTKWQAMVQKTLHRKFEKIWDWATWNEKIWDWATWNETIWENLRLSNMKWDNLRKFEIEQHEMFVYCLLHLCIRMFFCNINHCNDSVPCWDLDWTIKSYLILWNQTENQVTTFFVWLWWLPLGDRQTPH
jgi:hypothetical protein